MPPRRPLCAETPDLLSWQPEDPVRRYDERRVRAGTVDGLVARLVSELLRDAAAKGVTREQLAEALTEWGRPTALSTLNGYASQGREDQRIDAARLLGLMEITGDVRPLQAMAERLGYAVIPERHLAWIEYGQIVEHRRELERMEAASRRKVRTRRP